MPNVWEKYGIDKEALILHNEMQSAGRQLLIDLFAKCDDGAIDAGEEAGDREAASEVLDDMMKEIVDTYSADDLLLIGQAFEYLTFQYKPMMKLVIEALTIKDREKAIRLVNQIASSRGIDGVPR